MRRLKLNLPANDSQFLTLVLRLLAALTTLKIFQSPPDKVPSVETAMAAVNRFRQHLEGSKNGDRVEAALRKKARIEVTQIMQKIFHYLEAVVDEDDLVELQQAGFELCRPTNRKKSRNNVASASQAEETMPAGGTTGG